MKTIHKVLGAIWMAVCAYFFANLGEGLYRFHPDRSDTLAIHLFFVLLYLAGALAGFYLLIGSRWPRIVLGVVALLTVTARLMGLFAFFNALPYSFVGIAFDVFALVSVGIFLFPRRYAMA